MLNLSDNGLAGTPQEFAMQELKHSDDNLMELIAHRLNELQELEAAEERLLYQNTKLVFDIDERDKQIGQLTSQLKESKHELDVAKAVQEGLQTALNAVDPQITAIKQEMQRIHTENGTLSGQLQIAKSNISETKKLGDPKDLIAKNKKLRSDREAQTKTIATLKQSLRTSERRNKRLQEQAVNDALTSGDDRMIYQTSEGESLYIHPKTVQLKTPKGSNFFVAIRYWNVHCLGRLVTWNGKGLQYSDTKVPEVNELLEASEEAQAFLLGWFKNHVAIHKNGDQEIKIRR